jgi:nephrocystin-3
MLQTWRTVRVFISSTFRDMHAERDWLVKVAFPELRERMAKHNLYLVDIDLRWGITEEEAEQGKVLEVCLDEVEHCRPFFIGILGERYGSVLSEIPEDAEFLYPWLAEYKGHSLTALEIIYGVLRNPELAERAFFYFRDPQFIPQVPESKRADYTAENPEAIRKLTALKEKIRASGRPVMENYPCHWDDKQGHLIDLGVFGQQVLEDLWTAICAAYPEETPEADPLTIEREMHEAFAEERSRLHIGREKQAKRLTEYVQGKDHRPVVITGESGCGKSAFLANWSRKYVNENPKDFILTYFIGASPDSTNHFRLLRNMCRELKREFTLKEEIPEDDKKLPDSLAVMLSSASLHKERVIVVLDALDQLLPLEAAHGLGWLLDYLPEKAKLVVSSLAGDCLDVLRRRQVEEINLPPLAENEQQQIVRVLLDEWRRKLDERQMAALISHPGVKNPLYLRIALEELRLFGKFEELPARIKDLADNIPGMFDQVLERLEEDHGRELVTKAFSLIGCSRYGLSETELLQLLRREGEEQFPRALWARLARSTKMYLVQRGELIGFFHRQLAEAVAVRYLERKKTHAQLATYFENATLWRKLDEFPYQLQHAEEWEKLSKALSNLWFFKSAINDDREYEWMAYWRSLEGRYDVATCYQSVIADMEKQKGAMVNLDYIAGLYSTLGSFLQKIGIYEQALPLYKRSLAIRENVQGFEHADTSTSLNNLASLYHAQGKYDEAIPLYQRALEIDERTLGHDDPTLAEHLNNLALLYRDQGKYDKALTLCRRAVEIGECALGLNHPTVATYVNNMALVYDSQGKYNEALASYRRALEIGERTLGPDHPTVAVYLSNLALLYDNQKRYAEALPLYQRALEIDEHTLGPNHPNVAMSLHNLARFYAVQSRNDEALPLYQRALEIGERALGPNHPDVATYLNGLALAYCRQNRYAEALPLCQRALEISERALGPAHRDVAASLYNLARLYDGQGQHDVALPLYKRAMEISEWALGPDHPDVIPYLSSLAEIYYNQQRHDDAEPLFRRVLDTNERTLGSSHPTVATNINNLAAIYFQQRKYDKAEPLLLKALNISESMLGPNHPDVTQSLNNLAMCYYIQGRYNEALPLFQRAVGIAEKAFGANHPETIRIRKNLKACQEDARFFK